ncbi:MAG: glycosyl transferase [Litorilinea sp.]|nr:MAG: glycosyl transferase [Litorilinea sp.]
MPVSNHYVRRILLLIKGLGLGGAERLLADALPYLDRQRFDYHLAYLLPWKDALVPTFRAAGMPVHCLGSMAGRATESGADREATVTPRRSWRAAVSLPLAYMRLERLQRQVGFDLIHADLPLAGILARLLGRRHGIPVVYTEHNLLERYHPLTRGLHQATYAWHDQVLAVSGEVAASVARHGLDRRTRVATLCNGVPVEQVRAEATRLDDLRRELGLPPGCPVVGAVAVFRAQKRLDDWLAVAARVAAARPDVHFLLAGDGPEMPQVRRQVQALGLAERVCLPGFRADGRRLLGLPDVYLLTSGFEGLPMALLEAMALGKPVVATRVGGVPEAVRHGEEGWLAPVGDVDGLSRWVLHLLDRPDQARAMGARAAARVETAFHTRQRVQAIEACYAALLEPRNNVTT